MPSGVKPPQKTAGANIGPFAAQLATGAKGRADQDLFQTTSQALFLVEDGLNRLTSAVASLTSASGGSGGGGGTTPEIAIPVAVAVTEPAGQRYYDANQVLHTALQITPTVGNTTFPVTVTIWIDFDDGNGYIWQGPFNVPTNGQPFDIGQGSADQPGTVLVPLNLANVNWNIAMSHETGYTTTLPTDAVTTPFTISAAGYCPASDVSGATFVANSLGATLQYQLTEPGIYYWNYYEIDWVQPTFAIDPNYWSSIITVQKGRSLNVTGTVTGGTTVTVTSGTIPAPVANQAPYDIHANGELAQMATWTNSTHIVLATPVTNGGPATINVWIPSPVTASDSEGADFDIRLFRGRPITDSGALTGKNGPSGGTVKLKGDIPPDWTFPPVLNTDGSANVYRTFRFRIYALSVLGKNPTGNLNVFTLQTCWAASADYGEVTPTAQPNALNLGLSNSTFFNGTDFSIVSGVFKVNNIDMKKAINLSAQFTVDPTTGTSVTQLNAYLLTAGLFQLGGFPGYPSQMKVFDTSTVSGTVTVTGGTAVQQTAGTLFANTMVGQTITIGSTATRVTAYTDTTHITVSPAVTNGAGQAYTTGSLIAFIGDDSAGSGFVGAWFRRVQIGGLAPSSTPPFFADNNGNVVATKLFVVDSTGTVGFIGTYAVPAVGTYSGIWCVNGWFGGTNPSNAPISIVGATGAITACTLTLNATGITTVVRSFSYGTGVSGFKCTDNTSSTFTAISPFSYAISNAGTFEVVSVSDAGSGGLVLLSDATSSATAKLQSVSGLAIMEVSDGAGHNINIHAASNTAATATAGAATLPANPVGFWTITIDGTTRKIPYYAN